MIGVICSMADDVYGNSDFHQQIGKRKHSDRERYQAPAGMDDEDDEADYENFEDSIKMEEKKTNQTEAFKEEVKSQAATNHNVCGTKSIVFLYVLLIASSVMWAALLSLLFVKCTAEIQTLKTLLTEKDSQMRANFENCVSNGTAEIQTLKTLLTEKDSQLSTSVGNLETEISSLKNKVSDFRTCPCDWKKFSEKCYYFSKGKRDWKKAEEFCYNQDAVLAMVKTQQELNYIRSQVSTEYHLGLTDQESENNWKWLDGSPVADSLWNSGEPNSAGEEDCGEITAGNLNDIPCSVKQRWICEKTL
ncbi:CD209 antigen-like protein E isoform X8 [Acipenser ruthenus]|uniref:CD209 antigen-like protein E isoform X8 n=1 Tax=Acipenser ruthenus TaxID=7906 RepID=UPI0027424875|nr:CD209 antigen-like protein E isoform X8 [Acipenser ruthenus]